MNVKIFDIVNDEVEINANILLIPEFEALIKTYRKDAVKILAGLHYLVWPHKEDNPYYNIPEKEKDEIINNDFFKGRLRSPQESVFVAAKEKMQSFYNSTILSFHVSHKKLMENMSDIMLKDPKDWPSNMADIQRQLDKAGSMAEQFIKSQNAATEDLDKTKGDLDVGYDEGREYKSAL